MRAALYIRVSTEEQSQHGLSLGVQREALEQYAREHNYIIVGVFEDAGVSARKPYRKRPALLDLLERVKSGEVELILFTKLDRWFRDVGQYYQVQDVLDAHGVAWKAIWEDYETETSSGRLKVNIMLAVAQDEADRTSERIRAVRQAQRARGEMLQGRGMLGYKVENNRLLIDPEKAPLVREMFARYISGGSVTSVTNWLMEEHQLVYSRTHVRRMLTSRRYLGQMDDGRPVGEALITQEAFDTVQSLIALRGPRTSAEPRHIYLFSSLLVCSCCGKRMRSTVAKQGRYLYYKCNQTSLHRCTNRNVLSELKLEEYLLEHLVAQCVEYNAEAERKRVERKAIDKAAVKKKLERLKDLYINGIIEREEFDRSYAPLRAQLDTPEEPDTRELDLPALRSALDLYHTLDKSGQKEFWMRTIKEISCTPDREISFTLR